MNIRLKCSENHDWSSIEDIKSDLNNRSLDDKQVTRPLLFRSESIKM